MLMNNFVLRSHRAHPLQSNFFIDEREHRAWLHSGLARDVRTRFRK